MRASPRQATDNSGHGDGPTSPMSFPISLQPSYTDDVAITRTSLPGHFGSLTGSLARQRSLSMAVADAIMSGGGSAVSGTVLSGAAGTGGGDGSSRGTARASLDSSRTGSRTGSLVVGAGVLSASLN